MRGPDGDWIQEIGKKVKKSCQSLCPANMLLTSSRSRDGDTPSDQDVEIVKGVTTEISVSYRESTLPPSVKTGRATGNYISATLNGKINPNGLNTTYHFEYWKVESSVLSTDVREIESGKNDVDVTAYIENLEENTYYYYRLVAYNDLGTSYGDSMRYLTPLKKPITDSKAIIVAGGGPYEGNDAWDAIQLCANTAYFALTIRGYGKDSIYYLSHTKDIDVDGNGILDDVDDIATKGNLEYAIVHGQKTRITS